MSSPEPQPNPAEKAKEEFRKQYPDLAELSEKLKKQQEEKAAKQAAGVFKAGGTYYKKHFAQEVQFVLDAMLTDQKDRIYFYSKFPTLSKSTLEMKIRQSWHFLINNMDPEGKYRELWDNSSIAEDKNKTGIRIKIQRQQINIADVILPDVVEDETATFDWRPELDKFLVEAPAGSMFKKENLNLSDDAVDNLCLNLAQLSTVEFKVTNKKIVVIKIE